MTKLKLELAQAAGEILTREEQKRILGGASGSGDDPCPGEPAHEKCTARDPETGEDHVVWSGPRTGCPKMDKNPCSVGLYSCACVP